MLPNGQVSGGSCYLPPETFALPPVGVGEALDCIYQFTVRRTPFAITKRRSTWTVRIEPIPRSIADGLVHLAPRKWFTSWPAVTRSLLAHQSHRVRNRCQESSTSDVLTRQIPCWDCPGRRPKSLVCRVVDRRWSTDLAFFGA